MRKLFLIALFLPLLLPFKASATHIVGGEIFYECLGNNRYRVTLRVYRDCFAGVAPFDNPAHITAFNANGVYQTFNFYSPRVTNIPVVIDNPCLVAPPNVCVEEGEYQQTITLPPDPNGYTLVYQRCCRNNTILNLFNSGDQGGTYTVKIPGSNAATCNNAAYFKDFPPVAICANDPLVFDHSAIDPDGDSLVYRLCAPYRGANTNTPAPTIASPPPYGTVNYAFGYSATNPIDASTTLTIDPQTGLLSGTPTVAGQFVVGICVDEYRNGVLINTLRRDFQFNVANCNRVTQAIIPGATNGFLAVCDSLTYTFGNQSIGASTFFWDFGVAGTMADTATSRFPTFTFPDTGRYTVLLVANPGTPCVDSTSVEVRVFPGINAAFTAAGSCPGIPITLTNQSTTNYGTITDQFWSFGDGSSAIEQTPEKIYQRDGLFTITLSIENDIGCKATARDTLRIHPRPTAAFDLAGQCIFEQINLTNRSTLTRGQFAQYTWIITGDSVIGQSRDANYVFQQAGVYTVQLITESDKGCLDTAQQTITIRPKPDAIVFGDTVVCPGEPVLLSAAGGDTYNWGPFGADLATPNEPNTLAYPTQKTTYIVTAADDCYFDTAHITVDVHPTPLIDAMPDTTVRAREPVTLRATTDASPLYWSPATFIADTTQQPPVAYPEANITYQVRVVNDFGCPAEDSVTIYVLPICNELFIPEAFSPNGDGLNDFFAPVDYGQTELVHFQVFNRYGQLLYESNAFGQSWDGTLQGQPQPIGTYAYLLRVLCNGAPVQYSGNFTLLR